MTHMFKSNRWLGYAALICAALMFLTSRFRLGSEPLHVLAVISLFMFGIYCSVRGLFSGPWFNRICAGLAMVYWGWIVYSITRAGF